MKFASAILKEMGYGLAGSMGPSGSTVTPGRSVTAAVAPPTTAAAARGRSDRVLLCAARVSFDVGSRDSGIFDFAPCSVSEARRAALSGNRTCDGQLGKVFGVSQFLLLFRQRKPASEDCAGFPGVLPRRSCARPGCCGPLPSLLRPPLFNPSKPHARDP